MKRFREFLVAFVALVVVAFGGSFAFIMGVYTYVPVEKRPVFAATLVLTILFVTIYNCKDLKRYFSS